MCEVLAASRMPHLESVSARLCAHVVSCHAVFSTHLESPPQGSAVHVRLRSRRDRAIDIVCPRLVAVNVFRVLLWSYLAKASTASAHARHRRGCLRSWAAATMVISPLLGAAAAAATGSANDARESSACAWSRRGLTYVCGTSDEGSA